jgi:DNA-binding NarL/FixJ family response regulator
VLDPRLARAQQNENHMTAKGPFGLTPQELRVLEHLPLGLTNRGIGAALDISEDTVKTHLKRILFKLKAHDRAEAVAIAHREGLL